jgi:hypothetical protein
MTSNQHRWLVTIASSLVIHSFFCAQAVYALSAATGGMASDTRFFLFFLPHYFVMYFAPPMWPITNMTEVDWWGVAGKLAVAYPVSLLYGWILGAIWHAIHGLWSRSREKRVA